ncbi:hypothetical protein ACCO45_002104 [Purpureocillium lilacinum]|uniref:Uncharacterized protein n=1 Tax=Purpureocillium lilacinum TaxID=33203 RepID=A0ACC4E8X4_PURLI
MGSLASGGTGGSCGAEAWLPSCGKSDLDPLPDNTTRRKKEGTLRPFQKAPPPGHCHRILVPVPYLVAVSRPVRPQRHLCQDQSMQASQATVPKRARIQAAELGGGKPPVRSPKWLAGLGLPRLRRRH